MLQKHLTQIFMTSGGYESIVKILDQMLIYEDIISFLFLSSFSNLLTAVYTCLGNQEKEILIEKFIKSKYLFIQLETIT